MGRWSRTVAGGCRKRLRLFTQGEDSTRTAAQIAARAGQTERTFFRHLAGKREELFGGSALLQGQNRAGVAEAPPRTPRSTLLPGLAAAITMLGEFRRDLSRQRHGRHRRQPELGSRSWRTGRLSPLAIVRWLGEIDAHVSGTAPGLRAQLASLAVSAPTTAGGDDGQSIE